MDANMKPNQAASLAKSKTKLGLVDVLRMLVNDGRLDKVQAEKLYKDRKLDSSTLHPIIIGEKKWKDLITPHKLMNADFLSRRLGLIFTTSIR